MWPGKLQGESGVLGKARKYFNNDCMISLYNAFIYPYLIYGNQIWGSTYKTYLSKLQVLQNKAVRIVTGSPPRSNSENMYRCSGIMKLNYINTYLVGRFMYKIYHKNLPAIFDGFFRYNYHIHDHDHDTRTASHLHVPSASSNVSIAGIRYKGVIIWNKILIVNINPDSSEQSFKVMLKKCIIQQLIKNWIHQ